ncbi:MAG: outer membrane protein assembly factor BamA, partial [Desulfobacterales bacterium]|nr:outer membrane protein assembly factor BamA [Desulfobacterales bacterium]MDX2511725.1 outer membrane protein assembly factor BamA [Desulfobacterales bacterium]
MLKRGWLVCIALICLFPPCAYSQGAKKVAVLPFRINSQEDLSYLSTEIPKLIKDDLKREGAEILEPDLVDIVAWKNTLTEEQDAKRIGLKQGLDFVVWGSLTRIGQNISLDVKLIEPFTVEGTSAFFLAVDGIENLLGSVQKVSRDIGFKLFERAKITEITVIGNKRIEADAIERYISTKSGDVYVPSQLSADLKSVYSMGYFEDIRIESKDTTAGKVISFYVQEKPTIRRIEFDGNIIFDSDEIREALNIKSGSILNIFAVQNNLIRIESLYKEKNYHNVTVNYEIEELENNQGDLLFLIKEGKKIKIKKIAFEGNDVYTEKELKKLIKTNEEGFWSWLTNSGELEKDVLNQDIVKIRNYYQNNGFIEAKVAEPIVEYQEDMIYIKIKIDEGPKFKVGRVGVEGDLIFPEIDLLEKLKITAKDFYSREVVRNDILAITDLYSDEGYAYADIYPRINRDLENLEVNIDYVIKRGKKVYFESITITGNHKTRDKVIRRELRVYEQELFSGSRLKRGIRNLYRLDFFENVGVDTVEGSADDLIRLKLDVIEKPTGNFMFGGGYSSVDYGYLTAAIAQNNLFGRGQNLQFKTTLSIKSSSYSLSFTEPYLFDKSISAGFDIYNQSRDYDDYDKSSVGGRLRLGTTVADYTRLFWAYSYDVSDISNIDNDASSLIKDSRGSNITSATSVTLKYDSRDRIMNATEGTYDSVSVEYAGLGGNIGFTKYTVDSGWYYPLFLGTVGLLHGKGGYVHENSSKFLPDYERFYLGGMTSVRGFGWRDIHVEDKNGDEIG